jgi:ribonuclease HI
MGSGQGPSSSSREARVYTDGASTGSRGPGGYGVVISCGGKTREISGGERDTTNLRMEITAACVALEAIEEDHSVTVYADASYLVNCMRRGWYRKWRENGWLNHRQAPVANRDLWERLLKATQRHHEVRWRKVKGHSRSAGAHKSGNDRADELAVTAKKEVEGERESTPKQTTARDADKAQDVLGPRELNRATLQRQMLLRRQKLPVLRAIEHLVGMQAQAPVPPYVGLWTRLENFDPEKLGRMISDRSAVRIALMRNTVHLVSSGDCLALRPLMQPVIESNLYSSRARRTALEGVDIEALVDVGRALLEEQPYTNKELGRLLQKRWPDHDPASLARAIRHLLPLVQVPPRGVWGKSGPAAHTTAEAWLDRPLGPTSSLQEMVLRYLGAFGPATVADVQTWSGLTRLGGVIEDLRPRLLTFRDERGKELFDLPEAPRPDPDTHAPARFLPAFDNLILSHADRTRVIFGEYRKAIASRNGMVPATFLVDGFVRGTWKTERVRGSARLVISPFESLTKNTRDALTREGERLIRFVVEGAEAYEIRFTEP